MGLRTDSRKLSAIGYITDEERQLLNLYWSECYKSENPDENRHAIMQYNEYVEYLARKIAPSPVKVEVTPEQLAEMRKNGEA